MVVAAGAADRQPEEAARDDVDRVVALVGARDLDGAVVVVPRPEAEEAERRQRRRARPRRPAGRPASCALTNWSYGMSSLKALITQSR